MALVDFYQLAVLYNLSRGDAGVLSSRSHPPPMPPPTLALSTPSRPRLSAVKPDQATPLFSSLQFGLKTAERKRYPILPIPHSTPVARGSAILQSLQPDTDQPQKFHSAKYEQYLAQDFERHRVFVDIEVFMQRVLHVPENWKDMWRPTIKQIKRNGRFSTPHSTYTQRCDRPGIQECSLYEHLVDMGNAILDISKDSENESVKPRTPQRYLKGDPNKIDCGVITDLSPDVVAVHEDLPGQIHPRHGNKSNLSWANVLQTLEVKHRDSALVDGRSMPRLKVNGRPTTSSHNDFRLIEK